jgi:hypothetical protein
MLIWLHSIKTLALRFSFFRNAGRIDPWCPRTPLEARGFPEGQFFGGRGMPPRAVLDGISSPPKVSERSAII